MSPKQFYQLTPKQFHYAIEDYQREKDLEREFVFCSASPEVIKSAKTSKKMLPFAWDIKVIIKEPTEEDWSEWEKDYNNLKA